MNPFDAFVIAVTIVAVVMGYMSGLLRSLATILGYLTAAPIAIAIAPQVTAFVLGRIALPPSEAWIPLFVVFIAVGFVLGSLIRRFVNEIVGPEPGLFDRAAGAVLAAISVRRRAEGSAIPAARCGGLHRSPQTRTWLMTAKPPAIGSMRGRRSCCARPQVVISTS
jgi:membrane protein required for colicin V production